MEDHLLICELRELPLACALCCFVIVGAAAPNTVDTKSLLVSVDAATCRWSAEVKGTPMRLNHVRFIPGDDPSGWTAVSSVNKDDPNKSGSFVTVTLRRKKAGQVTMPTGKRFAGEKLPINFNSDTWRAMEHQADLIAGAC